MSPEIWLNKPYDNKSDMWALGCILYELCMLVPPFLANDMNGLALKVKTAPVARISKHYSEDLANLVASLLSTCRCTSQHEVVLVCVCVAVHSGTIARSHSHC